MTSTFSDRFSTLSGSFAKLFDRNRSLMENTLRTTQEESLRFINLRLERNAKILQTLRDSQGLGGVIAAEQAWLASAARDYVEGTQKFSGMLLELAANGARGVIEESRSAAESLRSATSDAAREIPSKAKGVTESPERRQAAE